MDFQRIFKGFWGVLSVARFGNEARGVSREILAMAHESLGLGRATILNVL